MPELALPIFLLTYVVVALGRLPGWRIDRAGAALVGAAAMIACGALDFDEALAALDADTLVLLFGMMIVVASLRLSGFFRVVEAAAVRRARHPLVLLVAIVGVSAGLSAFLVNDTICLVLTVPVLELVLRLGRPPLPYLLAVAMAANIGSVATLTGNPQNMIVGSLSGIAYGDFAAALWPVAAVGCGLLILVLVLAFPREFLRGGPLAPLRVTPVRCNRPLALKSVAVLAGLIGAFFAGVRPAEAALLGGAYLLLTRRVKPQKIHREIDWSLLVMFAGLFVVVAGLERTVLTADRIAVVGSFGLQQPVVLATLTAALSNLVSNVPAVLVLKPFVEALADRERAWLIVAMASTLAGNLTLLGSVANLIVAQRARSLGVELGFGAYLRIGVPVTALTIVAGTLLLMH